MEDSSKNAATMTTMRATKRATTALATTRAVAMVAAAPVPRASTTPSTTTKLTMVATTSILSRVVAALRLAMAVENTREMGRTIAAITRHRKMISVAKIKRSQDRLKLRRIHLPTWALPRASIGSLRPASPLVRRFPAQLPEIRDRVVVPEVVLWCRPATEVALPRAAKAARSV